MMLRLIAVFFGVAFIFAGVAGFLPTFTQDGLLFGLFEVNFTHSMVHIVSGVFAIMCATSYAWTRWYFIVFGLVYGLVAVLGLLNQGDLWMMHVNTADNFLHLGIAVASLFLGFSAKKI